MDNEKTTVNDSKAIVAAFEEKVKKDVTEYLQHKGALDPMVPECPDVEEKWPEIVRIHPRRRP